MELNEVTENKGGNRTLLMMLYLEITACRLYKEL